MSNATYMREAVQLAEQGMRSGLGGPFGCVVVRRGKIVGRGSNRVTSTNDPTAHAEVVAIRDACTALQTFQLTDCELYTSCEPCPMCLSAIYWARVPQVYYGFPKFITVIPAPTPPRSASTTILSTNKCRSRPRRAP